jgi:hypothetical protein
MGIICHHHEGTVKRERRSPYRRELHECRDQAEPVFGAPAVVSKCTHPDLYPAHNRNH